MNSRKTNEDWRILLRQRSQSGLSVKKWCERNGIAYDTYKYWEKKIRQLDQNTTNEPVFVKLPVSSSTTIIPSGTDQPYPFQIDYREIRIGVSDTADISVLADILKTLQTLC